ncbi:PREDICTED: synaptic vesicle glycoprotein 2B-like, partial [Diuraphis noxia]|uniref:synaptic vesicle glycoprotein 2B-like n=1 Tax=Diuraphis noxia TaxID=143948 RepID=UPI0007636967
FGSFHYYILFICGSLFTAIAISVTSVSFVVPSAQCDFQMTSIHKGILNGASMIGMFSGSFIWGYVADSRGRRYALMMSMTMDGVFNIISSVSQIYPVLIFCRLMSGFGNTSVAWLIIPQTFRIEYGFFLFRSWNLFTIICSLPSLTLACLLVRLPESPKFLLAKGKHDETIDCLKFVYKWNNKTKDKFPVTSLILPDCINEQSNGFFKGLYESTVGLFTSKYKFIAIITCIIQYGATTSYYMLMLWFPELMNRFRWYETSYSGPKNMTNMCEIVSMFYVKPEETDQACNDNIDKSVYLNIVIIGIACLPTSLIVPMFVNRLGLRFFL